jgi:membrane-associated phospholipid phosphatase
MKMDSPTATSSVWTRAYRLVHRSVLINVVLSIAIAACCIYPTDQTESLALPTGDSRLTGVLYVENYLRFIPTVIQIALPLVLADKVGMVQLLYGGIATTLATHIGKRALNDQWMWGNRLGERPSGGKHNMPSGHSSMAACAVYFIARRYSLWLGLALTPLLLLTMYTRVALNDHTVSAVIAGCLVGIMMTALFTSKSGLTRLLKVKVKVKVKVKS